MSENPKLPMPILIDIFSNIKYSNMAMNRAQSMEPITIHEDLLRALSICARMMISDEPTSAWILDQLKQKEK